jgi:hypothetical protein
MVRILALLSLLGFGWAQREERVQPLQVAPLRQAPPREPNVSPLMEKRILPATPTPPDSTAAKEAPSPFIRSSESSPKPETP